MTRPTRPEPVVYPQVVPDPPLDPGDSSPAPGLRVLAGPRAAPGVQELVGEVLGGGARNGRRARRLLGASALASLSRWDALALERAADLTPRQGRRLRAAFRLGRAVERDRRGERPCLRGPEDVARYLATELRGLEQEHFQVLLLDGRSQLLARVRVSVGTLHTSLVHPREVFREALRRSAAGLLAVHNHPSGDPEPSEQDLQVTRRLRECGQLLGVPLVDHVVLGEGRWVSLRERLPWS